MEITLESFKVLVLSVLIDFCLFGFPCPELFVNLLLLGFLSGTEALNSWLYYSQV